MIKKYEGYNTDNEVILHDRNTNCLIRTKKYGDRNSISWLNNKILQYITDIYGRYGFSYPRGERDSKGYDIDVNGEILNTEYISKMVNNYTVFKAFIAENKIKDEETFYQLLIENFDNVYHFKGDFFKRKTLPILIATTRKGNIGELRCIDKFEKFAKSKGLSIAVEDPTITEDISGIDGKFRHGDTYFTLQVKPFTSFIDLGTETQFKSTGSLSLGGVNYLVLYSDDNKCVIIKNQRVNPIKIKGNTFVSPNSNIVYFDYLV